jgi:hypothetical protein
VLDASIGPLMDEVRSSETSVSTYQTTRHNNPEDSHLLPVIIVVYSTNEI